MNKKYSIFAALGLILVMASFPVARVLAQPSTDAGAVDVQMEPDPDVRVVLDGEAPDAWNPNEAEVEVELPGDAFAPPESNMTVEVADAPSANATTKPATGSEGPALTEEGAASDAEAGAEKTQEEKDKEQAEAGAEGKEGDKEKDKQPTLLRITAPIPLNTFASILAQKAQMTFVPNPLVEGTVSGIFSNENPLTMLEQAARANGYQMTVRNNSIELENDKTRKALPIVTYTRVLKYLRAPYVRDPGTQESTLAISGNISSAGSGGTGGSNSGGSSGGSTGGTNQGNPSSVPGSQAQRMVDLFKGILSEDAYLNYDMKTSTVVARDIDVNIAALDALINQLDVNRPNILVGVQALEVNSNPRYFRGLDWSGSFGEDGTTIRADIAKALFLAFTGNISIANDLVGFTPPAGSTLTTAPVYTFSPASVSAVLRFLNDNNLTDSKARWTVTTEDNESGVSNIARQQPIVSSSGGTLNVAGSVQFSYVNVGAILRVTPQLRPGGIVRLQIRPELSNIIDTITVQGSDTSGAIGQAPVIDTRSSEVIVSMPLGKTLVLGGLQNLVRIDANTKVPFLGDIPFIGPMLFGSKDKRAQMRNFVLIVEPRLVDYENIPEFENTIKQEMDVYKWKKEYGAGSGKNINSTADPGTFIGSEGKKLPPEPLSTISPPQD